MTQAALIHGIELHTRTLVPYRTCSEQNTFLVGTQSLRTENHIQRLTFDNEVSNSLEKKTYPHELGEIWHLAAYSERGLVSSCFNRVTGDGCSKRGAIFKFQDDSLNLLFEVKPPEDVGTEVGQIQFEPSAGKSFAALVDCQAVFYDLDTQQVMQRSKIETKNTLKTFAFGFNPTGDMLVLNSDSTLRGLDTRNLHECWSVPNAHTNQIRSMDVNPNRPNILATSGDDCAVKFWDIRKHDKPVVNMRHHSHWVWSIRYNPYYDQLVLTGSSDSKVHLLRVSSVSSDEASQQQDNVLLETFDDHEDSIYCTEWATNDPWTFASISYDGRLVINRVSKEEKFRILC